MPEHASRAGPPAARPASAVLTERIAASLVTHEPGWRLPLHSALARRFNVTLAEIDNAIRELTARHLVRRLADGRIYRTSPAEYLITLEGLPGIGSHIDPMGATIICASRHVTWRRVSEDIALMLGLPPRAEASVVRCQWTVGGLRAALSTTYFPDHPDPGYVPGEPSLASLDATLNSPPAASGPAGWGPATPAALHIEVQPPAPAEARVLQLTPGVPAITVTVSFSDLPRGHPVALTAAVLRSDLFRIVIESPACDPPEHWPDGTRGGWAW